MTDEEQGRGGEVLRGRVAGGVRMIFVALSATVGARIGEASGTTSTSRALLFVFAGAGIGYVIGGVFGRLTLRLIDDGLRETPRESGRKVVGEHHPFGGVGVTSVRHGEDERHGRASVHSQTPER